MMKKFLALVLAAALLAGCSAPAEPKPTQEPTPTPETENKETEKKEVATSGKYVVVNTTGETITELYILSLIHISEPTRQAEISYAVFCLKKKKTAEEEKQDFLPIFLRENKG